MKLFCQFVTRVLFAFVNQLSRIDQMFDAIPNTQLVRKCSAFISLHGFMILSKLKVSIAFDRSDVL